MKTKCAGYIRVSTIEQATTGLSMQAQRDLIERYASEHDMELVEIYADEGISAAKSLDKRAALLRLIADAEQHKFSVFLFKDITRYSRNAAAYYKVQERLDDCKVGWIAIEQPYLETVTPTGKFQVSIMLGTAQLESDQTGQRIKFTQDAEVARGYFPFPAHCAPLGYTTKKIDGHNLLVIDEETAPQARALFYEFLKTGNATQTARRVGMAHCNLLRVLRNHVYIGEFRGIPNFCEPLISIDDFNRAQQIMRHTTYSGKRYQYIFSGIAYCGLCGSKMAWNTPDGKYPMCRCRQCKNTLTERETERQVIEQIEPELNRYKIKLKRIEPRREPVKSIESRLKRLNDLYIDGILTRDEFNKRREDCLELMKEPPEPPDLPKNWHELYDSLDKQKKNVLWKTVLFAVIIKDKKVNIAFEPAKVLAESFAMSIKRESNE